MIFLFPRLLAKTCYFNVTCRQFQSIEYLDVGVFKLNMSHSCVGRKVYYFYAIKISPLVFLYVWRFWCYVLWRWLLCRVGFTTMLHYVSVVSRGVLTWLGLRCSCCIVYFLNCTAEIRHGFNVMTRLWAGAHPLGTGGYLPGGKVAPVQTDTAAHPSSCIIGTDCRSRR